ncbi:LAME_0G19724g1_1 [Lachancea meyersii CBS 8951]|uniref:LAME_0G19724g1_1 n=1 Tax=Lachancea meyersii CBS 8951 TaxID=1266667 RepID=A0A1G4KCJ5_9SACH|nr:LAME_0G19724g1_1 [Lachancea meyersii CBS 8951]
MADHPVSKPLLKLKLLESLREGDFASLDSLVKTHFFPKNDVSVREVAQLILHYAVQVAPLQLIKDILAHWLTDEEIKLDINHEDPDGNTALHLAAYQSRGDVVNLLLDQSNINDCILNNSGLQPIEMCKNLNIAQMMQVRRSEYLGEVAQEFRRAFVNRDCEHLEAILAKPRNSELLDINGTDPQTGDTVLHEFVRKRDVVMCQWILSHGGDPFKRDRRGKLPLDLLGKVPPANESPNSSLSPEQQLKRMLEKAAREQSVIEVANSLNEPPTYKGYLRKWTNFAQGYRLRWFILSPDGTLSYYKDQDDTRNACRGSLNMSTCYLHLDSSEKLKFEIIGGFNGTVRWHLKGNHPVETNRWVWAVQGAIRFAKDRERTIRNGGNTVTSSSAHPEPKNKYAGHHLNAPSSHSLHSSVGRRQRTHQPQRSISSISSMSSGDADLNDNLTNKGKEYVTRVKSGRTSLDACVNSEDNKSVSSRSIRDNVESTEDVESEQEYLKDEITEEFEDEDMKFEYGPHHQEVSMIQRSITIELSSLAELLENKAPDADELNMIKKSLKSLSSNFESYSTMSSVRDKKLLKLLQKQRDVNQLWIRSVKELELELIDKSERLASLDIERKNLKKLLQKKLLEISEGGVPANDATNKERDVHDGNVVGSDNSGPLEEIAEFMNSNKEVDEDSDIDEFFDAEETESFKEQMQRPADKMQHDDSVSGVQERQDYNAKGSEGQRVPEKEATSASFENIVQPSGDSKVSTNFEQNVTHSGLTDGSVQNTERAAEPYEKVEKHAPKTTNASSARGGNEPLHGTYTEPQEKKKDILNTEGSYLGYEDGLRTKLALSKDDRPKISLWSVLKSMIGKDMTRMSLPVTFNEPTSLLQRVAEDLEYSSLLTEGASYEDSTLRLLYVAVFSISSYSSTTKRVAKPFNPILGETYEYSRPDEHFRFFTEQVSHHPPISATWSESAKWDFWGESRVDSNFNGRSFEVEHLGLWYLRMRPDSEPEDELYTWKKPNNTVVGILVGNPQVDNHGDVEIVNHKTGDRCMIHFKARGWRSSNAYEVKGEVYNKDGGKEWIFGGHWNESLYAKKVLKPNSSEEMQLDKSRASSSSKTGPNRDGTKFLIWHVHDRPEHPFNLTQFAVSLNAPQPKLLDWIPPTDTRLRPDQRAMEEGRYDAAAKEKDRVEQKQRAARKRLEKANKEHVPKWFEMVQHPITKKNFWQFKGEYWRIRKDKKFSDLPDIF